MGTAEGARRNLGGVTTGAGAEDGAGVSAPDEGATGVAGADHGDAEAAVGTDGLGVAVEAGAHQGAPAAAVEDINDNNNSNNVDDAGNNDDGGAPEGNPGPDPQAQVDADELLARQIQLAYDQEALALEVWDFLTLDSALCGCPAAHSAASLAMAR